MEKKRKKNKIKTCASGKIPPRAPGKNPPRAPGKNPPRASGKNPPCASIAMYTSIATPTSCDVTSRASLTI